MSQAFAPATFERIAGQLIVSPGTGGKTGIRNARLSHLLYMFAEAHGYVSFDSSTGFHMPDDDAPGPDGALSAKARWDTLTDVEQEGLPPLVPDMVVELRSTSQIAPKVGLDNLWESASAGTATMLATWFCSIPNRRHTLTVILKQNLQIGGSCKL